MRKAFLLTICLLNLIVTMAQTQQGIVKTRGRMVNGVLQPGVGLQGATVQVKDHSALVSGTNGIENLFFCSIVCIFAASITIPVFTE